MIVISNSLALAPTADNPLGTPIFGWQSLATAGTISATSEDMAHPASNLANPSTALRWQAQETGSPPVPPSADQYLTVAIDQVDPIDYLAIAVHNLGSGNNPVSVEGTIGGSPLVWFELVAPSMQANDDPVIFRFAPESLAGIRLRIQAGDTTPYVAVLYTGKLLVSPRGTHTDHVPINLARQRNAPIGVSESGHFLGKVVISESRASPFALKQLKPDWYRTYFDPFIRAAKDTPFFFSHRPQAYPGDVGFCFMTNDPMPSISFDTGRMSVDFQMQGVAK